MMKNLNFKYENRRSRYEADFLNMVLVITNTKVIPKVKFGFLKPFWSSLVLVKSKKWAQNIGTLVLSFREVPPSLKVNTKTLHSVQKSCIRRNRVLIDSICYRTMKNKKE